MSTPDLSSVVIDIIPPTDAPRVRFPGGAELSATLQSVVIPDPIEQSKALLAQANAALIPLTPVFKIVDAIVAIGALFTKVYKVVSNPTEWAEDVEELAPKLAELAAMFPPLAIPFIVADLLDVLISFLRGMRDQLVRIVEEQTRLVAQATEAAKPGNAQLKIVIDCAQRNVTAQMESLNAGLDPINRLIGLINLLCGMAGLDPLPSLDDLGSDAQAALAPLDDAVNALTTIRNAIPV